MALLAGAALVAGALWIGEGPTWWWGVWTAATGGLAAMVTHSFFRGAAGRKPSPGTAEATTVHNIVHGSVYGTLLQAGTITTDTDTTSAAPLPRVLDTLPAAPLSFTGRDDELRRVLGSLHPATYGAPDQAAVTVLSGMGGVGKTSLAVTAGHEARRRGWFSTTIFCDLRGTSSAPARAEEVLERLLVDLGLDVTELPTQWERRVAAYHARLDLITTEKGAPTLVILDNVTSAAQVASLRPRTGGHRVLVTSREHLGLRGAVRHIELDQLTPADSTLMLARLVRAAEPEDPRASDTAGLERLANACGHLPLALEVSAAMLAAPPHRQSPGILAADLDNAADRLARLSLGDDAPLTTVFDASFERLTSEEARVFCAMAASGFPSLTTTVVAELTGIDTDTAAGILGRLAHAHLVRDSSESQHEADRWSVHDLLAAYGQRRQGDVLGRTGTEADEAIREENARCWDRVSEHYVGMAIAADSHVCPPGTTRPRPTFEGRAQALAWFDRERANLRTAAELAVAAGHVLRACLLMQFCAAFLRERGHLEDLAELARLVDEHADPRDPSGLLVRAEACNAFADALTDLEQFDDALVLRAAALELTGPFGPRPGDAPHMDRFQELVIGRSYFGKWEAAQQPAFAEFDELARHERQNFNSAFGIPLITAGLSAMVGIPLLNEGVGLSGGAATVLSLAYHLCQFLVLSVRARRERNHGSAGNVLHGTALLLVSVPTAGYVAATLVAGMLWNYAVWGVLLNIGHMFGIVRARRTSARFRRSQELLETKMRVTNNRFVPTETLADLRRECSLHRLVEEYPDLGGTTPAR